MYFKYHVPNTQLEQYGHHMLFMYFPFRYKNQLKYSSSYNEKLNFPDVLETGNLNSDKVKSYAVLVEGSLKRLSTDQESNIDPFGQQENEEVSDILNEDIQNINNDEWFVDDDMIHTDTGLGDNGYSVPLYQDFIISENICSLYAKQWQLFEIIHK